MSYLHGVETKDLQSIPNFRIGETSTIAVVGIAKTGDTELTLVTNLASAIAKYGEDYEGTTIISALKAIFADGNTSVLVVNVATSAKQTSMLSGGKVGKDTGTGKFYTQVFEESIVTTAPFVSFQSELIAGIEKVKESVSKYGMKPNFIICPGFSQVLTIGTKMRTVANTLKAKAIIDLYATDVTDAIAERTANYNYSDSRVLLTYPNQLVYNEYEEKDCVAPLSQLLAAEIVSGHEEDGFWVSPSNRELKTVTGSTIPIVGSLTDSGADNQLLNAKGIITIFKTQGLGTRTWGNWTSAFPESANLENMIAASIVKDVIDETIERESLPFADKNISYATLDFVVQAVRAFFYRMKAKGAMIDGEISYSQANNPLGQIAQGQFVFDRSYCPYPSLDRLTYNSMIDIKYLSKLFN